ncbi:MAG: hypothetical protein INR62_12760 [Rhodospirillales bacterium]|nr:hypothetical protein [Acetobacter sp.]
MPAVRSCCASARFGGSMTGMHAMPGLKKQSAANCTEWLQKTAATTHNFRFPVFTETFFAEADWFD